MDKTFQILIFGLVAKEFSKAARAKSDKDREDAVVNAVTLLKINFGSNESLWKRIQEVVN